MTVCRKDGPFAVIIHGIQDHAVFATNGAGTSGDYCCQQGGQLSIFTFASAPKPPAFPASHRGRVDYLHRTGASQ